jgi:hypothetical protein
VLAVTYNPWHVLHGGEGKGRGERQIKGRWQLEVVTSCHETELVRDAVTAAAHTAGSLLQAHC